MAQSTAEKLGIKAESTTLILGRPLEFARTLLAPIPDGAAISEREDTADLVLLFADDLAAVTASAQQAYARMHAAGRFWIAYRKGANRRAEAGESAPLHRDTLQAALAELGLDGVTLISVDDIWSAMRVKAV